jgi:hypothetical protein
LKDPAGAANAVSYDLGQGERSDGAFPKLKVRIMKMKHRKTGEIVKGTLELRKGRAVMILENGRIVEARGYEVIKEGLERLPAWATSTHEHDDGTEDDEDEP